MLPSSSDPPITPAAAAAAVPRNEPPPPMGGRAIGLTVGGLLPVGRLAIGRLVVMSGRLGLLHHLAAVPDRAAVEGGGTLGTEPCGLFLPEDGVAHRIEEPAGWLLGGRAAGLQFLDAAVGALQRFVLHQHGLHQRVDRVGRLAQALRNRGDGVGIARRALQSGEPVEKIVDHLAFLRCHGFSPSLRKRRRQM